MLKKSLLVISLLISSATYADSITDVSITNISPLNIGDILQTDRITTTIKPFNINMQKCEIEFNDGLKNLKNEFKSQIDSIWQNIKQDATYLADEMQYLIVQESIVKILAATEFIYQKGQTQLISAMQGELEACLAKVTAKSASTDVGGGAGDQGNTYKIGLAPKEAMATMECYAEVLYPSNTSNEDMILLKQYEDKYRKLINQIMYGQLNITLENMTADNSNNVCGNITQKKKENLAYLVDMLENQKIILLNNKNIKSSIYFELMDEENKVLNRTLKKDAGEITEIRVEEDEIAKQTLFTDMEPESFKVFKSDIEGYMISMVKNYGTALNEATADILQDMIIDEIFKSDEIASDLQTLLIALSKSPEYFYNRYTNGAYGQDYRIARIDIIKEVLNKTLLYAYSKGEYVRGEKLKLYYANMQQYIQVNNAFLLQILMLDRYMYRYKERLNSAIVKNIAKKKEIEKEIYFRDFCTENKQSLYDVLCERK